MGTTYLSLQMQLICHKAACVDGNVDNHYLQFILELFFSMLSNEKEYYEHIFDYGLLPNTLQTFYYGVLQ